MWGDAREPCLARALPTLKQLFGWLYKTTKFPLRPVYPSHIPLLYQSNKGTRNIYDLVRPISPQTNTISVNRKSIKFNLGLKKLENMYLGHVSTALKPNFKLQ